LFTIGARRLGRVSGLIRRERDLTAAAFAQTLVFGWIDQPHSALESFALRLDLSAQALHRRMGPAAHAFFLALIAEAMRHAQAACPARRGLLGRFSAVVVEDSSIVALPADLAGDYRGHGGVGSAGRAAVKVVVRWELLSGQLLSLRCVPGVTADRGLAARAADLPVGALHLADQGFFDAGRWADFSDRSWISRVPAHVAVATGGGGWQPLAAWLAGRGRESFDGPARLVQRRGLVCRLTARRCPAEVAARRRQKLREYTRSKKGREPSARQMALCDWLVLATNVPAERLTAQELWVVYRCRWQVELLFKRGKGPLGWAFSHGRTGGRVLTELLAKVLGLIVTLWASLLGGGPLGGRSPTKQAAAVRRFALRLLDSFGPRAALDELLGRLQRELRRIAPQPCRRKRPGTRQLLLDPKLAA
jgi:hypothetical protein